MNTSDAARALVDLLAQRKLRIVLAESCTGGMVSAELAKIPGVSDWLCGSAVTYRSETKTQWLGVYAADIQRHTAVSSQVAEQMAAGVLAKTPEAHLAAAITGHFGPQAPAAFDGLVFVAIANRADDEIITKCNRIQLQTDDRLSRQREATAIVLSTLREWIASAGK